MSKRWLIHAIFECLVCGKQWQDYLTSQKAASAHAAKTGHKVEGEAAYHVEYGESK